MKVYEDYWELTNEFTDYNNHRFCTVLEICLDFIDEHRGQAYSNELYKKLQEKIQQNPTMISSKTNKPKNLASVRKSINQLVKLGFIEPFLSDYIPLSREYIKARTNKKRRTLLSKIVYTNSSFSRSVIKQSNIRQMNFLIKTLIEHPEGKLNKSEISALMLVDLENFPNDHLTKAQLDNYLQQGMSSGFIQRKYNQIGYLWNLLAKLDDLKKVYDELYFSEDAERIFGDLSISGAKKRDPYLHRLYKNSLQEESEYYYGDIKCMLEKLTYPVLVASHIKPFILSDEKEAYDPNNGLLLSRTLDSLFDLKYISFDDEGCMLKSKRLADDVWEYWREFKLDVELLNPQRKTYLQFHRNMMNDKDLEFLSAMNSG